jgi:hypothetical protein
MGGGTTTAAGPVMACDGVIGLPIVLWLFPII